MAEHVVDTTEGIHSARTTGELTRCRDCRWGKAVRQIGCVRFEDCANPDGFCAWAERRGGEAR